MFKVDKINSSLDCDVCNKVLVDPVLMPCGYFICKKHLDKLLENPSETRNNFNCEICEEEHFVPKNGFKINDRLQNLLNLELNNLKASPLYDECKHEIEEAQARIATIELLETNSDNYIYDYFAEIRRQVDMRREDLKWKIDQYSDEIIKSVDKTQENCMKLSKEVNQLTINIEKSKTTLNDLIEKFDKPIFNDKTIEAVKIDVEVVNKESQQIIDEYNSSLIGNKNYKFQFDELSIEDIFGRLYDFECNFMDSIILDAKNKAAIQKLCKFSKKTYWKLQYRASRDGFTSQNFHAKCDNVANTLTVIKSTSGNIFGGFAEKPRTTEKGWVLDPKAFIYSLVNEEDRPFRVVCSNKGEYAIFCNSTYGPTFGAGYDIFIASDSNVNRSSYSEFGQAYIHPKYQYGTTKAQQILAGSYNFQTLEIEVFTKAN